MKTIPNYSHVILYKNEISMLEFYKNMKIKGLQEESYNFSNSFSSFLNCMFVDFTFSKTSVGIECYDKKIKTAQEKIKGLEEIYDFSTFNLEQSKNSIEIVANNSFDDFCDAVSFIPSFGC